MYLAMGMSYELYWDGDPQAVRAYREADRIRQQRANETAWLQGAYVYDAIGRLASVLNGFVKHPKAKPYPEKPYDILGQEKKEPQTQAEAEKKVADSRDYFMAMVQSWNKQMSEKQKKKGGASDGGND